MSTADSDRAGGGSRFVAGLSIVLAASLCACAVNPRGAGARAALEDEYEVVEGRLVGAPDIEAGGHRLLLVLEREVDGERQLMVAVTYNQDERSVLEDLAGHLLESSEPVVLFGNATNGGGWREYQDGVDFYFHAIAYHRPIAERYFIVLAGYGDRFQDVITEGGWRGFLGRVASLAGKAL